MKLIFQVLVGVLLKLLYLRSTIISATSITVSDYHQHSVTSGADAKAAAFIELTLEGKNEWGAGIDGNTVKGLFSSHCSRTK